MLSNQTKGCHLPQILSMQKKSVFIIFFIGLLVFVHSFFTQPACAADSAPAVKIAENAATASPQSAIEEKLKKIQQLLADNRSEKNRGPLPAVKNTCREISGKSLNRLSYSTISATVP